MPVKISIAIYAQRLNAEGAIQTFKDHFIAISSGVAKSFPVNQFHKSVRQAVLALNSLRQSNITPKLSTTYQHASFDHNNMPLA